MTTINNASFLKRKLITCSKEPYAKKRPSFANTYLITQNIPMIDILMIDSSNGDCRYIQKYTRMPRPRCNIQHDISHDAQRPPSLRASPRRPTGSECDGDQNFRSLMAPGRSGSLMSLICWARLMFFTTDTARAGAAAKPP